MNARFQSTNVNGAYHFAVFIGNGCGNLICRLLQLNAKRCCRGFGTLFRPFTGQDGSTRDHDPVANQRTGLQRLTVVDLPGDRP